MQRFLFYFLAWQQLSTQASQKDPWVEGVALRDNPVPFGDTDYFPVAISVQKCAKKILVPSQAVANTLKEPSVSIVGHAPIEEWVEKVGEINPLEIYERLHLNPDLPVIVYTGVYGNFYTSCFEKFYSVFPIKKYRS